MHDKMKITIRSYDTEVSVEMPNDSGIEDVIQALRGMLLASSFDIELIDRFIDVKGEMQPL